MIMADELIDFLQKEDVKQFIKEHVTSDVNQLLLNPPAVYKERIKEIAAQVLSRQKVKGKLDDWGVNFDLIMPPPVSIEQASSNVTCAYKQQLISGDHLIDLTGGMGIDLLALGESFAHSTYVEKESTLCQVFKHNASVLGRTVEVINTDALTFLNTFESPDKPIIYLDPSRRSEQKSRVFRIEDCSPNLMELIPLLQQKAHVVFVKYSPLLDIHAIINTVHNIKEIHVVSVKNDCKELLIVIDFAFDGAPQIHCVNLHSGHPRYSFDLQEERQANAVLGEVGEYLLEPNSSIMKAGAFKQIASDFKIDKLGEHTHLYTTNHLVDNFPGRLFKVIREVNKKSVNQFVTGGKINVISRNYPLSATDLKKKWKLKDGGDQFLIAFKDQNNKPRVIIGERLDSSI